MNSKFLSPLIFLQAFFLVVALCGCKPSQPPAESGETNPTPPRVATSNTSVVIAVGDKSNQTATITTTASTTTDKEPKAKFIDRIPIIGSGNPPRAKVKIPHQGQTVEVDIELKRDSALAGVNEQAKAGVSALQIDDYTNAVTELIVAVKAKPKNESYHFALAIAMELTGDFSGARTNYAEANKLAGGSGSAASQAGLKRLEARGK